MFKGIPVLIFFVVLILGAMVSFPLFLASPPLGVLGFIASFLLAILASSAVRVAAQWERGLVLRLGKFSCIKGPGLFFIIPIVDNVALVDTRVLTLDIPTQQVITKDNVPVSINGVVYFKVSKVEDAIIKVQNYTYAMSQYALAALRDVVGGMSLDQLLSEREQICNEIEKIVEKESQNWGLDVTAIKIQDIDMPEELKKMMSRQASAEREKRATITKAEGDKLAAVNLAAAAETMIKSPGSMQLRTLQTIDGLGPSASNTVVLAIPLDVMESFKAVVKKTGE
ncbi:MAG: SPFH domain-containing protein [Chlamydiota bacterium]